MKPWIILGCFVALLACGAFLTVQENWRKYEKAHVVKWGDDFPHGDYTHNYFVLFAPDGKHRFELGLRADGVVVWREIK